MFFRLSLKDKKEGDFMKIRKLICFFVVVRNCFFVDVFKFVLLLMIVNDRKVNLFIMVYIYYIFFFFK